MALVLQALNVLKEGFVLHRNHWDISLDSVILNGGPLFEAS